MQITIKDLPKYSSNKIYAGLHWTQRKKIKESFLWLTKSAFSRLQPIESLVDLEFEFYFVKNALDSSNCSFMAKMLEDCLVEFGVLKSDTIKHVRRVILQSNKSKAKDADSCIITIKKII